ncbi:MAG: M15 family metallopeptidase [Oscillospiraceae bacterium]|nr:M15 family metallopeptidase [Oscillospiraceae bacterium]
MASKHTKKKRASENNKGALLACSLALVAVGMWSWAWVSGALNAPETESATAGGAASSAASGSSSEASAPVEVPGAEAEPEEEILPAESESSSEASAVTVGENESAAESETGENAETQLKEGVSIYEREGLTYLKIQGHEMLLVNKSYGLPSDYGSGILSEAQEAFDRMAADAYQAGCTIWIGSGFRDYETQETLFNRYAAQSGEAEASRFSARPGHSEHQSGLAMDIAGGDGSTFLKTIFEDTAEYAWLDAHAAEYGFILRYPAGKEWATGYIYEPWHFRYVGAELAQILKASALSVEEYAGLAVEQT